MIKERKDEDYTHLIFSVIPNEPIDYYALSCDTGNDRIDIPLLRSTGVLLIKWAYANLVTDSKGRCNFIFITSRDYFQEFLNYLALVGKEDVERENLFGIPYVDIAENLDSYINYKDNLLLIKIMDWEDFDD